MKNNLGNNLREGLYKNNQTKPKPDIDRNMVLDPPAAKWQQEQNKKMYSEEEVNELLETQRGNSYVAILSATKDEELASIALNAPEPGGKNGTWKK